MKRELYVFLPTLALAIAGCADVKEPIAPRTSTADRSIVSSGQGLAQVSLCHKTAGANPFILIALAPAAVDAHLAHGDGRIGDAVPGQPGMRFGADCQAEVAPIHFTLTPSVDGYVKDGGTYGVPDGSPDFADAVTVIQVFNQPIEEDRGIIEFDISMLSEPVGHATLSLSRYSTCCPMSGTYPFPVLVFVYSGDGALTLSDFAAGSLFATFDYAGENVVTLDVTSAINSLIASGASRAGFNLRKLRSTSGPPPYVFFNSLEYPPAPTLDIHTP